MILLQGVSSLHSLTPFCTYMKHKINYKEEDTIMALFDQMLLEKFLRLKPLEIGVKSVGIFNLLYKLFKKSVDW